MNRAYSLIVDYLLAFGMSRIYENSQTDYPRTVGSLTGFVGDSSEPVPGDLIRLTSIRSGFKWRVSWLVEIEHLAHGDKRYLCRSIQDGELCWWTNVGVEYLHRPTLEKHPEWRWSDDQFAFDDKWTKACGRHDPYMYRPLQVRFNDDGTATVGTRSRHNFDGKYPEVIVQNWKKSTLKSLSAIYLECVEAHKSG